MAGIAIARDPWVCTHCKKARPARTMRRTYIQKGQPAMSCPGHDPRDHDFQTNCDFALRYVIEMSSPEGPKTVCQAFRGIIEARRHASVYTRTRLVAAHVEGYPHVLFTMRLEEFNAWAAQQDWEDQRDYHSERFLARPGAYGHLLWFRDENNAVMAKTIWGEPFSFS